MSVEQKVKQIIVEQLGVDESQVDPTASFVDDLGADSLDIVELVMAFEEAFDLDIPDEDAEDRDRQECHRLYRVEEESLAPRVSAWRSEFLGVTLETKSRSYRGGTCNLGWNRH